MPMLARRLRAGSAPYNLVLAFSNSSYADGTSLGNVLADYEDQGAGLVQQLSFSYRGPDQPYGLNGGG